MPSRRTRAETLQDVNLLELAPVRVAPWREVGGRVVVERPIVRGWAPGALFERLSRALSTKRLRFDEVGSCAWLLFDGEHSVRRIAEELRGRFGESVEPAEERLGEMVRMLRREGLVAYPEWDEGAPPPAPRLGPEEIDR